MKKTILYIASFILIAGGVMIPTTCFANPYGSGVYDADVPYGKQTSLSIATDGSVSIPVIPTTSGTLATGNSVVTVTSTDVVGYKLYVRALTTTNMTNGAASLSASANGSPAALAVNTWGYNTDASSNFVGLGLTDTLIKTFGGPAKSGDVTTFTYGVKIDLAKPSGQYSGTVVYTAAPETD